MEAEKHGVGSVVIGSILAVPLYFVVYFIVASIAFVVLQFMNSFMDGGITRWAQISAALFAPIAGVYCGRKVLDMALKAWNGWPVFVIHIALAALLFWIMAVDPWRFQGWWEMVLYGVQNVVAIVCAFGWIGHQSAID